MIRYGILQTCVPHYRLGVFDGIADVLGNEFKVLAGDSFFDASLRTVANDRPWYQHCRNVFLFRRHALYQSGLNSLYSADALIVEGNPRVLSTWILLRRARARRIRTAVWGHALGRGDRKMAYSRRRMFSLASSVICYCYEEAEMLQDVFPEKAILVAGNSALSQRDCRVLDSPEPKRTNVLFIGRLIPEKKGLLLLEAIARLQQNNIDVGAVIIGEGPELSTMREIARNLGLRNINFAGFHNEIDEIRELAESTFAMVSPGYIGLSVVHSLSMGLPFIYSIDEPNAPEVEVSRIGWNSMNFRGGDSSDLATKIASVFYDRGSWLARGNAFCELIKSKYSVEQMANRFVNFFLNCKRSPT